MTITLTDDLKDAGITDKRELGHDLEPLIGREVRGGSHDALNAAIIGALNDIHQVEGAGGEHAKLLSQHGFDELAAQCGAEGAEADAVPEGAEGEAGEPSGEDGEAEAAVEPVIIEVMSHPGDVVPGLFQGDIVVDPEREAAGIITGGIPHRKLTERHALELLATGRCRLNRKFSNLKHFKGD